MDYELETLRQVVELDVAEFCEPGHEPCYSDERLLRIIRRAAMIERQRLSKKAERVAKKWARRADAIEHLKFFEGATKEATEFSA